MGIPWLGGAKWSDWTREERFFCTVLFGHGAKAPDDFARWVVKQAGLDERLLGVEGWDLGYEVCLYRDYLWEQQKLAGTRLPLKRTFDLCLFAPEAMVIIEAKCFEDFSTKQNKEFEKDPARVRQLLGRPDLPVYLVALASSHYLGSRRLRAGTLDAFEGHHLSWKQAAAKFEDPRLALADELYRRKPNGIAQRRC